MGKSFVYNSGSAEDNKKKDELWLDFGIFIDGTLNNKENTRLRRKYRKEDENSILNKWKKGADLERERLDYEAVQKGGKVMPPTGKKEDAQEYHDYLLGIYRDDFDKAGTDNSYSNDDTNISRMWKCCTEDYRIYIEGMGTTDKAYDSQDGFAFGSGQTGIRARVRLACERIVDKMNIVKDNNDTQKRITQITLDVFGFSRGAASARNFVHEVNAKKPYKPHEIEIPDDFYPMEKYESKTQMRRRKTRKALGDADGMEINPKYLIDGKMPRLGHLGYSLLKQEVITPEELEDLKLIIRFVGIYDTVSSYYEIGALGAYDDDDGKPEDDEKWGKLAREAASSHFTDDEKELSLHDLGDVSRFQKLVHFTAKDEHRRNFSLTRINQIPNKAIEKNFPGVHCDIGGAYENEEEEYIDEIGTSLMDNGYVNEKESIPLITLPWQNYTKPKMGLEVLKQDLIDQHWYRDEELKIMHEYDSFTWKLGKKIPIPTYLKLTGTRKRILKEYSYIFLHFMEEFCSDICMDNFFNRESVKEYPLNNFFLEEVKSSLHRYVFADAPEWEFVSDAELLKEKKQREEIALQIKEDAEPEIILPEIDINEDETPTILIELPELKIDNLNKQNAIRRLRHDYLHWSSTRDWFGMEPNDDRKRVYYPKE